MGEQVRIYDTTLRDGCQGAGVSLSLEDKLDLARRLDEFGLDWVEGGWPGANPKDDAFFAALREQPLRSARLAAFGSTRRANTRAENDANLRRLVEAGTPTVALVAKASGFHVDEVLRTTREENLAMVGDSVRFLQERGREVVVDAEHFFDGYRADAGYALSVLAAAADAGAGWLVLCDTNGGSLPHQIADAVEAVVRRVETGVGIHTHNDGELAVANALAAVGAGARHVQGTINGYGERVGNANLCSVLPNLALKLGYDVAAAGSLEGLTALSAYVDDIAHVGRNPRLPFVGYAAFAHKGGLHVHAVARDASTYEHVAPERVGNERRILVGELSGRSNVIERARELGIALDPDGAAAREVAAKLKELEREGLQFEDAEASFELLLRRGGPDYRPQFEPRAYAVDSRQTEDGRATTSVATAEVAIGDAVLWGEAQGNGPIDALEQALRRALVPAFPYVAQVTLTDFRSQIARSRPGARGAVRVRITGSAPGAGTWTTVGSSGDLLHAAWVALTEALEYAALTRAGVAAPAPPPREPGMPLAELAPLLDGELDDGDRAVLRRLDETDWRSNALDLSDPADRDFAAHATSLGAALFYSFGNFCAIAAHPRLESVQRVNVLKGRPLNQVGSLTTTPDRFPLLFDWELLPHGLGRAQVLELIEAFCRVGPIGFRGPAIATVPGHLTSLDGDVRTTQLIASGRRCASNDLVAAVLDRTGRDYLFITSANVSGGVTGRVEPAHYDLRGMQDDLGASHGIVVIGHRDEAAVRASYPRLLPMSTSILAFHRLERDDDGRPALVLERHGSLHVDDVRRLLADRGFGLVVAPGARQRLPLRDAAAAAR